MKLARPSQPGELEAARRRRAQGELYLPIDLSVVANCPHARDAPGRFAFDSPQGLFSVPIRELQLNGVTPAGYYIDALADSFRLAMNGGYFPPPIFVRRYDDGTLCVVDGQHRRAAAIAAGLSEIPALVQWWRHRSDADKTETPFERWGRIDPACFAPGTFSDRLFEVLKSRGAERPLIATDSDWERWSIQARRLGLSFSQWARQKLDSEIAK